MALVGSRCVRAIALQSCYASTVHERAGVGTLLPGCNGSAIRTEASCRCRRLGLSVSVEPRYITIGAGFRQRPRVIATLGSLVAAALVAGCGSGGSGPGAATTHTGTATTSSHSSLSSPYDQALVYAKCVRTHGVPLWPAPDNRGQFDKSGITPQQLGVSAVTVATAQRSCRSSMPNYSAVQRSSQLVTEALRFSRCMRAHGSTNFPDPKSSGAIVIPHSMENSPVYLAALNTCIHKYGVPPPPSPRS